MHTLEFQAPIRDHRFTIQSDLLPAEVDSARITVTCDEEPSQVTDILSLARAARASFPHGNRDLLREEFATMRHEWEARENPD